MAGCQCPYISRNKSAKHRANFSPYNSLKVLDLAPLSVFWVIEPQRKRGDFRVLKIRVGTKELDEGV